MLRPPLRDRSKQIQSEGIQSWSGDQLLCTSLQQELDDNLE